ncbi:SMI1/KNR4 family protein [Snodgrassella alvi]|uniref:SMI1/KNR4 family protein n=1 Tax=Snodgrassella alvi TaxID=1196083 RepID=UPI0035A3CE4B
MEQVAAIEQEYGFQLPPCYKIFITQIGNGVNNDSDAACPFYGIYSLHKILMNWLILIAPMVGNEPVSFIRLCQDY